MNTSDIRKAAQARIEKNLWKTQAEGNNQLEQIGKAITQICNAKNISCTLQRGPMKKPESANRKLKSDYSQGVVPEGDWLEMKDLVRLTLFGRNYADTVEIAKEVKRYCGVGTSEIIDGKGLSLMKDEEYKPDDAKRSPCGYSGYNFVVRLRNGLPGEIQVNVPEVLYGKGPREDFCKAAGQHEWDRIRSQYRIESSLHHALYEIYRLDKGASPNSQEAAKLSREYLDYLRGAPNFNVARALQEKLTAFKEKNRSARNNDGPLFHWDEPTPWPPALLRQGGIFGANPISLR